jgi:fructose-1,6-bisphosphatase/inositol monophosphatase family enzyme
LADRAAEEAMRAILAAEVPRDGIVGEEFGTREGSTGRTWVLDPIDGTAGFLAGRAIFGNELQFRIDVNDRANVAALAQGGEDFFHHR